MLTNKYFIQINKQTILVREMLPDNRDVVCVIVLIHGIGDHSGRYVDFIKSFKNNRVAWITVDLPGHGLSSGKRGYFRSNTILFNTITHMLLSSRYHFSDLPVILYGHSMGANICVNYVLRFNPPISGLILSSAWLGISTTTAKWKVFLTTILAPLFGSLTVKTGINRQQLTENNTGKNFKSDYLAHNRIALSTFISMHKLARYALNHAENITVPTLILSGKHDTISERRYVDKFKTLLGNNVHAELFDNMSHDLHLEFDSYAVSTTIIKWLNNNILTK